MTNGSFLENLLKTLGNIASNAISGTLQERYTGRIPDNRVFTTDTNGQLVAATFAQGVVPDQNYLQVLVNHMYLKQDRKLWVSQEHLGAVWMSFNYDGTRQTVPFMIGRDLLVDNVKNLPQGARIEFQDVRVGKVYPYTGDTFALYVGLWSTPTIDWSSVAFSAIDIISSKIKVADSLSKVLDMVEVLNQGISTVLGLKEIKAVLNFYQEFQDPISGDTSGGPGALRPGYYVMVNAPNANFDPTRLTVVNGRLLSWSGNSNEQAVPFYETDFMLYSITSLDQLSSASSLFRKQYQEVQKALIGSKADKAKLSQAVQEYHTLQSQIVTSPDLTMQDQNRLIDFFKDTLNADAVRLAVDIGGAAFAVGDPESILDQLPAAGDDEYKAYLASNPQIDLNSNPAVAAGEAAQQFSVMLEQVTSSGSED